MQAIAYILCGIMLPRAYELTFMPAIRNNFSYLEEFPEELRRVIAQNVPTAVPPPQPAPAQQELDAASDRSRSPVNEPNQQPL